MNMDDLREKSVEELRSLDGNLRDELFRLKMKHAAGHLDKPAKIKEVRRNIARLQTVIGERA